MQTRCQLNERWQRHVSKLECTIASESAQSRADAAWSTQVWNACLECSVGHAAFSMQMWHAGVPRSMWRAACSTQVWHAAWSMQHPIWLTALAAKVWIHHGWGHNLFTVLESVYPFPGMNECVIAGALQSLLLMMLAGSFGGFIAGS